MGVQHQNLGIPPMRRVDHGITTGSVENKRLRQRLQMSKDRSGVENCIRRAIVEKTLQGARIRANQSR